MTSAITTHVLDTSRGMPAAGVHVWLDREQGAGIWELVGEGNTDADGRLKTLLAPGALEAGSYRITFDVGAYFAGAGIKCFWRLVTVAFVVEDATKHLHVPLLVSPFGYSTYRGS
ncbi:MAG TPA: hydroxyisourate hydrolase [Polyangiaceae bacterium]